MNHAATIAPPPPRFTFHPNPTGTLAAVYWCNPACRPAGTLSLASRRERSRRCVSALKRAIALPPRRPESSGTFGMAGRPWLRGCGFGNTKPTARSSRPTGRFVLFKTANFNWRRARRTRGPRIWPGDLSAEEQKGNVLRQLVGQLLFQRRIGAPGGGQFGLATRVLGTSPAGTWDPLVHKVRMSSGARSSSLRYCHSRKLHILPCRSNLLCKGLLGEKRPSGPVLDSVLRAGLKKEGKGEKNGRLG